MSAYQSCFQIDAVNLTTCSLVATSVAVTILYLGGSEGFSPWRSIFTNSSEWEPLRIVGSPPFGGLCGKCHWLSPHRTILTDFQQIGVPFMPKQIWFSALRKLLRFREQGSHPSEAVHMFKVILLLPFPAVWFHSHLPHAWVQMCVQLLTDDTLEHTTNKKFPSREVYHEQNFRYPGQ